MFSVVLQDGKEKKLLASKKIQNFYGLFITLSCREEKIMASQKEMISKMIQVLKKLPEGTEITTFQLVREAGFDVSIYDAKTLFPLHFAIFDEAEENGLELDMSKHENKLEGLPFNLDYVVRHTGESTQVPKEKEM